jgi:hypothetical protein
MRCPDDEGSKNLWKACQFQSDTQCNIIFCHYLHLLLPFTSLLQLHWALVVKTRFVLFRLVTAHAVSGSTFDILSSTFPNSTEAHIVSQLTFCCSLTQLWFRSWRSNNIARNALFFILHLLKAS